jgi:DNA repair protein RecO (recombination protein O)
MSRETKCRAIVLKKQPFNEGDEIITFYSRELGKIRCLAKSVKSHKSKLQQKLQGLFLVDLSFTHGKLPKIISAEPVKVFSGMRENLQNLKRAFYAQELVLKFTPDEQKNEQLFFLLEKFLEFLNSERSESILNLALAKFQLEILQVLGLAPSEVANKSSAENNQPIFFSPVRGGFFKISSADALKVAPAVYGLFLELRQLDFENVKNVKNTDDGKSLEGILSQFIEYQLERKVKSEKFLRQ